MHGVVFAEGVMKKTKNLVSFGRKVIIMNTPGKVTRHNHPKIFMRITGSDQFVIDR